MRFTKARFKTPIYIAMALVSLILMVLNLYVVKTLDVFGSPFIFAFSVMVEVVLLVVLLHSLLIALATPLRVVESIALSAWSGILN